MSNVVTTSPPLISLVVPFLNEEEVLPGLFKALAEILPSLGTYRWELVLVDDGSTDASVKVIGERSSVFPGAIRVVRFSRNFGHQCAVMAGLRSSRGDAVIVCDADLQDPPSVFGDLLRRFAEGYDVVYAIRQNRVEGPLLKLAFWLFYRLFRQFSEIEMPVDAGDFGLMSRRAAKVVGAMSERDIVVRGLRSWVGFRHIGVPYNRPGRQAGATKYSIRRRVRFALSSIFGFSTLPLRLASWLGLGTAALGAVYGVYVLYQKFSGHNPPAGWASLAMLVLFLGGTQLITVGILGEYLGRIYEQVKGRPLFVVAEELEFNN